MITNKNLVVIAAGGGNDVFSAIAFINAHHFNKVYKNIVLFGVLGMTPFHTNDQIKPYCVNIEEPIIVPTLSMKRYIVMRPPKEIFANESMLPEIINILSPQINHYACLSPKYSAQIQAHNIRGLFLDWGISPSDTIIELVDFGGDILTDGNQSTIISPELDAFSLAIVRNLSEYESRIAVCFPGVDGELDTSYLETMCNSSLSTSTEPINPQLWIKHLQSLYIKLLSKRPGNTIPNMLNVLDEINNTVKTDSSLCKISKTFTIGKDKYSFTKDILISMSLQNRVHYFDININNPFVKIYNSDDYDLVLVLNKLLDIYSKQSIVNTVDMNKSIQLSDLYLQYLRKDLYGLYTNRHLVCGDINENINEMIDQNIMFVNIIPSSLTIDKKMSCLNSIISSKEANAYDILFY